MILYNYLLLFQPRPLLHLSQDQLIMVDRFYQKVNLVTIFPQSICCKNYSKASRKNTIIVVKNLFAFTVCYVAIHAMMISLSSYSLPGINRRCGEIP